MSGSDAVNATDASRNIGACERALIRPELGANRRHHRRFAFFPRLCRRTAAMFNAQGILSIWTYRVGAVRIIAVGGAC